MSFLQLLKETETFKKVKAELLPKYIGIGTSMALFYVEPLKNFMKHLIDIQGIDSNNYHNVLKDKLETLFNSNNYISPEAAKLIPKTIYYNDVHGFKRSVSTVTSSGFNNDSVKTSKSYLESTAEKLVSHNSKNMDPTRATKPIGVTGLTIAGSTGGTFAIDKEITSSSLKESLNKIVTDMESLDDKLSDSFVDDADDVSCLTKFPKYSDNPSIEEVCEVVNQMIDAELLNNDLNSIVAQEKEFLTMNRDTFLAFKRLLLKPRLKKDNKNIFPKVKNAPKKAVSKKKPVAKSKK